MAETEGNIGSLWISLGMDTSQAREGMRQAEQQAMSSATRINDRLRSMTTGVQAFAQRWAALPMAIGASIFAVQQAFSEFQRFYNMAKEGAKDLRMDEAFKNVAQSVGADAEEMTAKMVKATGRAVEETALKATAMRGLLGGINEKTLTDLSGAAKVFARSTGQATGEVFNQMVNSVIMQMPRQMMRLRVITREEMREIQKAISMGAIGKEDIAAEMINKANTRGKQMGVGTYDLYSAFSRFGRAWDELIEIGGKLTALVFVPLLEIITPLIDLVSGLGEVMLNVLLPVLKPVYEGLKKIGERAYEEAEALKKLWDAVAAGEKPLKDLANKSIILTVLIGYKYMGDVAGMGMDWKAAKEKEMLDKMMASEEAQRLNPEAAAEMERQKVLEAEKIQTASLLARRAREVQYEQAILKSSLETTKQENAIKLELVKARHGAELKLLDIKSKHEITMAKRGGASSEEAFGMEMTAQAKKNSMTESQARKEAGIKSSIARQEMELEIKIENEKNKYKAETMERERVLAEKTSPGSPAAYAKLVELTQFQTHYKKLEQITREGKEKIIRARYGGDIEQARLNAEVAAAELAVRAEEQGSVEQMKAVALEQTVRLEKMALDTRIKTMDIEDRLAVVQMEKDSGLISEIAAQEKILSIETDRYNRLKEEEAEISKMAVSLEKATGKKFDPFKDSIADLLKMNKEIQNNDAYNSEIKSAWDAIVAKIIESREALQKQGLELEKNLVMTEKMKRDAIASAGPAGGQMWLAEQYKRLGEELQKLHDAGLGEVALAQVRADKIREIDRQLYTYRLESATNLNDAFAAKAKLMLDEMSNAYAMWANTVADNMSRSFSDFFFDVMEGKVKTLQEYLTGFLTSMNRAIADFLSKKFTGMVIEFLFPELSKQEMIQTVSLSTVADMQVGTLVVTGSIQGLEGLLGGGRQFSVNEDLRVAEQQVATQQGAEIINIADTSGLMQYPSGTPYNEKMKRMQWDLWEKRQKERDAIDEEIRSRKPSWEPMDEKENLEAPFQQAAYWEEVEVASEEYATSIAEGAEAIDDSATSLATGFNQLQRGASSLIGVFGDAGSALLNIISDLASSVMNSAGSVVESSGFSGAVSSLFGGIADWFGGLDIFHDGGVVGASSDTKKLAGGLQHDEVVAVLQKGEVVIPKGGVSDFIDKYSRAAGGPVEAGKGYLTGEQGRELFAPSYGPPRISASLAKAAEAAWNAKRVAAMEAKDLAQYTTEYNKYRKYELEREAWEKEQQAKAEAAKAAQEEGGGLMSYLPTLLMTMGLKYGGAAVSWLGGLLGLGTSGGPAWSTAALMNNPSLLFTRPLTGAVDMGEYAAASALSATTASESTLASGLLSLEAERDAYFLAQSLAAPSAVAAGAAAVSGTGATAYGAGMAASGVMPTAVVNIPTAGATVVGAEVTGLATLSQLGAALPGIGATMVGTAVASMIVVEGIKAIDRMIWGPSKGLPEYSTQEVIDSYYAGGGSSGIEAPWYELVARGATAGLPTPAEMYKNNPSWSPVSENKEGWGWAAKGGTFPAGKHLIVGEEGPELFVPQTSGTIIPNGPTEQIMKMFSADGASGFIGNAMQSATPMGRLFESGSVGSIFAQQPPPIALGQLFESGDMERLFGSLNQGPEIAMREAGGPVSAGLPYLVGEGGAEAFIAGLPRFHSGGVVGGGVPNQIVNVTNKIDSPKQKEAPQVIQNTAHVNVSSLDGADAYRVLSANRDALASIFSEMRLDNNSRLRR